MQQLRKFYNADAGEMGDLGSLFDDDQLTGAVSKQEYSSGATNPDFYVPKVDDDKATNRIYKARIRFLPNWKDPAKSKISKFLYFIANGEDKFYVDCPSNFDAKKPNIITEAYFATWKHDTASVRQTSSNFKRKSFYWALVQIVEDKQHPELEGKIKIMRFGNQIDKLIVKQAEEVAGRSKVNVFNPFTGKELFLDIREKTFEGEKQITYDESYFADERSAIMIDGKRVVPDPSSQPQVFEYLKANSPDLSQTYPQQWDEETETKVIGAVRDLLGVPSIFNTIYKKCYGVDYVNKAPITAATGSAPAANKPEAKTKPAVDARAEKANLADKLAKKEDIVETKDVEVPFLAEEGVEEPTNDETEFDFNLEELPEEN